MVHTATTTFAPMTSVAPVMAAETETEMDPNLPLPSNVTAPGKEFTANGLTTGGEFFSSVATRPDGGYVIAYTDTSYTDGEEGAGIRMRIFDKDGKGGPDIHVNNLMDGGQYQPQVAILANGDIVVAFNDEAARDGEGDAVMARIFDSTGKPLNGPDGKPLEFQVNTSAMGDQENSSITALADGGFLIAFQSGSGDGSGLSIRAQRYNADGSKNGGEFQVNGATTGDQELPSITALKGDNAGGFVAVYESHAGDNNGLFHDGTRDGSIIARIFHADGTVSGEIVVDKANRAYVNTAPNVVALDNGGYAVTWQAQSENPTNNPLIDDDDSNIQMQIFDAHGNKVGDQLQVNQDGNEYQQAPKITELSNHLLLVTWEHEIDLNNEPGEDPGQIKGRVVDEMGNPVGPEFTINGPQFSAGDQHGPSIAALPNGQFIVTWTGDDGDDDGIRAQIFSVDGNGSVTQVTPLTINIGASLTDTDGSEKLSLSVSGVPAGVTLTDGAHTFMSTAQNHGMVDVSDWKFANLTVVGATSNFQLTVTATSTETADPTHPATVSQTIDVVLPSQQPTDAPHITGGTGNDTLFGGSGNDVLTGGGGNDAYQFGRGGGHDSIVNGTGTTAHGELDFGANITNQQLWFQRGGTNNNDLTIIVMGTHDQITVGNWFGSAGARLAEIKTVDGVEIDAGKVLTLVQAMASYSSAHTGFDPTTVTSATQLPQNGTLENAITANWHG
jgi:hypothetical protein